MKVDAEVEIQNPDPISAWKSLAQNASALQHLHTSSVIIHTSFLIHVLGQFRWSKVGHAKQIKPPDRAPGQSGRAH